MDDNYFGGVRGRLHYGLLDDGWIERLATTEIYHYDEDAFGVVPSNDQPLPGEPQPAALLEQTAGLTLGLHWG